jgi:predicted hotdog family 3-hydroxylacyl-ACP dehydratase
MIDKAELARLIPHAGTMCLLERVTSWDERSIRCVAVSHRDPGNPLATDGRLGTACGVEYAAQAMAIHGGLSGVIGERPKAGYLMSLRALTLHRPYLDDLEDELIVEAERLAGEGAQVSYRFNLTCVGKPVLEGRAAVLLEVAAT